MAVLRLTVAYFQEEEYYLVCRTPWPQVKEPDRLLFSIDGPIDTPAERRELGRRLLDYLKAKELVLSDLDNGDDVADLFNPLPIA